MKKVTVIIPNYNGLRFLKPCFDSLRRQTYRDFHILMIDNASVDESVSFTKENYPEVEIAVMEKNLGFSGGVNEGIRRSKTPYVILLNNDVEADEHYIEEMVKAIQKSSRIFSVSSRMIQYYDRTLMDDAGDLYTVFGWGAQRGVGHPVHEYSKSKTIFTACAGAAIYRRKVFEKIGYFDLLHFAYLEDIDIGYRARLYGFTNTYAPDAIVYHVGSGTSGSRYNSFKVKLAARNNIYLLYKNMAGWQLVLNALPLAAGTFVKYLFFLKRGFAKDYMDGLTEGIRTRKQCKKVAEKNNFLNQLAIEAELIWFSAVYAKEFLDRKLKISNN